MVVGGGLSLMAVPGSPRGVIRKAQESWYLQIKRQHGMRSQAPTKQEVAHRLYPNHEKKTIDLIFRLSVSYRFRIEHDYRSI